MNPALALSEGTRIENFEILRQLGRGGFGVTYLANEYAPAVSGVSEPSVLREVAIKEFFPQGIAWRAEDSRVIPTQDDGSQNAFHGAMKAFLREAQAIARLDHPAIVRIYRVFQTNGTAYFVMPYLRGKSLRDILRARGRLTQAEIERHILPVLDGLEEAHRAGMVHRDIKPDNIMIREGALKPVLIDFGAARVSAANEANQYTRMSELVAFTPGYAPIEQYARAAQQNRHDPHTDIYAFCATLYHCVTGQAPPESSLRAIESHSGRPDPMEPARTPERESQYAPALLAAIDWGLEVAAINRPQSVAELRDCLLGHKPPPTRGNPAAAAPETAQPDDDDATVVINVAARQAAAQQAPAPAEPPKASPAPPAVSRAGTSSKKTGVIIAAIAALVVLGGGGFAYQSWSDEKTRQHEQALETARQHEAGVTALLERATAVFATEEGPLNALQSARSAAEAGRAALADGNLQAAQSWMEQSREQTRQATVSFLQKQRDTYFSDAEIKLQTGDVAGAENAFGRGESLDDIIKEFQ